MKITEESEERRVPTLKHKIKMKSVWLWCKASIIMMVLTPPLFLVALTLYIWYHVPEIGTDGM